MSEYITVSDVETGRVDREDEYELSVEADRDGTVPVLVFEVQSADGETVSSFNVAGAVDVQSFFDAVDALKIKVRGH